MLTPALFVGKFAIAIPFEDDGMTLQSYISHYESEYLNNLFGAELCTLFLEGLEDEEIYTVLYEPFAYDSTSKRKPIISEGVVIMLQCFIYAHFIRQDLGVPTSGGHVILDPEGGDKISDNYNTTFPIYNEGIKTYKAIQQFIKDNSSDYPEFKGTKKQTTWYI